MKTSDSTRSDDSARYDDSELDVMDRVASPRFNPWLALILLMLGGFLYIWIWGALLRG